MRHTTEFDEITVFGARGTTLMILARLHEGWQGRVKVRALVDDIENGFIHPTLGIPVISSAERLRDWADLPVLITVANCNLREATLLRLVDEGATLATACFPGGLRVDPDVTYGPGSLCLPENSIGPNVVIGEGALVIGTMLAHDVELGAFSILGGYGTVYGHVEVGRRVNLAPNCIIGNGTRDRPLRIGDDAVIGIGALVARDVEKGARMVGNPALTVERWKKFSRWLDSQ